MIGRGVGALLVAAAIAAVAMLGWGVTHPPPPVLSPPDPNAAALAEWHRPCLFYVHATNPGYLLAAGGDLLRRPAYIEPGEWYQEWRLEGDWFYIQNDEGKHRLIARSIVGGLPWSTGESCNTANEGSVP